MSAHGTSSDNLGCVQCGGGARRRAILNYLALQERPVGRSWIRWAGAAVGFETPARFARSGPRQCARDGRHMLYRTNAERSGPSRVDGNVERYWRHQLSRVKERAEHKSNPSTNADRISLQGGK